jgi:photosystem II stability/assembly factor-like uncharacterized protein
MTWTSLAGITTPAVTVPVVMNCSVFVDGSNANDVFAELFLEGSYPAASSETLWRSQDGGTTWHPLSMPHLGGGWAEITVVGTRLVAFASYNYGAAPSCVAAGSRNTVDDLYASDDGGMTWKTIGQDLISKGLDITDVGVHYTPALLGIGTTLFVQTYCDNQQGQGGQQTYWRSTDGGDTWTALAFPAGLIDNMRFTPSPSGSFYGVAVDDTEASISEQTTTHLLYSSDSGATWNALPPLHTLPGVPSSQSYVTAQNIIALPDGSVLADIKAGSGPNTAVAQMYVVHPQDATPTWQRYAPSEGEGGASDGGWDIASTSSGLVLRGWHYGASKPAVYLSPLP